MRMFSVVGCLLALSGPPMARACDLALALTVDVSGSISSAEYDLQMQGLADALGDPEIAHELISANAAVMLVQWSGTGRQVVSLPWRQLITDADLYGFADEVRSTSRAWRHFSTAIGDAIEFTAAQFQTAPPCLRQVIDVSGDGLTNEGIDTEGARDRAVDAGISINGLAIENAVPGLTDYYHEAVVGGAGAFVITATSYDDYPRAIRRKLLTEIVKPSS